METYHLGQRAPKSLTPCALPNFESPVLVPICCRRRRRLLWACLRKTLTYEHSSMSRGVISVLCSFSRTIVLSFPSGSLSLRFSLPEQCQAGVPPHGIRLKYNQITMGYSHIFFLLLHVSQAGHCCRWQGSSLVSVYLSSLVGRRIPFGTMNTSQQRWKLSLGTSLTSS